MTLVRPARAAEAATVAALFNAINAEDCPPAETPMTAATVRRDLLGPTPWATLLVGVRAGALVGIITGSPLYDSERAAGGFFLIDLFVRPDARRFGVGRALVAGLAAAAVRRGAGCLWWGVDTDDEPALGFYRAIGAVSEGPFQARILEGAAYRRLAAEAAG